MDFNITNRTMKRCLKILHDTAATDYRRQNGDFMPLCASCHHTVNKVTFVILTVWGSREKFNAKTTIFVNLLQWSEHSLMRLLFTIAKENYFAE